MGPLGRAAPAALALALAACARPLVREGGQGPSPAAPPAAAPASQPAQPAAPPAPAPPEADWTCPADTATVVAVGDMRLDGPVGEVARRGGWSAPLKGVLPWLAGDVRVGNLETSVTTRGRKVKKKWNFRSPPKNLAVLRGAFEVVNLANNHVMDYGPEGLADTVAALDERAIAHVGAGKDLRAALKPVFVDANGIRLGFIGLTSTLGGENHFAGPRKAGVAYADFDRMGAWIREAKKSCDVLFVCYHAGEELAENPHELQRAFGRAAVEAGADAVLAHHPHVIQAVEIYRGKPILHSLGNFLFVSPTPTTRYSVIARVAVGKAGPCAVDFLPVDTNFGRLAPAPPEGAAAVRAGLDRDGALGRSPKALRFLLPDPEKPR